MKRISTRETRKVTVKNQAEIQYIQISNRIISEIFSELNQVIKAGITPIEIESFVKTRIYQKGGSPSFLNYSPKLHLPPFPAACCVSVNDTVIHGIPDNRKLKPGDILTVDIGVNYSGYFGDAAHTYLIPPVSKAIRLLSYHTYQALLAGIHAAVPGVYLNRIGKAMSEYLNSFQYHIIKDYSGHGVGYAVHEPPAVLNYYDPDRKGPVLRPGMVLAVEPMAALNETNTLIQKDRWTVKTKNGTPAVHWEHSIVITEDGQTILSAPAIKP